MVHPGSAQQWETWFRSQLEERRQRSEEKDRELERRERIVFAALMVAGILTLGLGLASAGLVLAGAASTGIATFAVDLLSGGGTAGLWRLAKSLGNDRKTLSDQDAVTVRTSEAFTAAQLIPDQSERTKALAKLSQRLTSTLGAAP